MYYAWIVLAPQIRAAIVLHLVSCAHGHAEILQLGIQCSGDVLAVWTVQRGSKQR